jgi:hypothetical protein
LEVEGLVEDTQEAVEVLEVCEADQLLLLQVLTQLL